MKKIKDYLPFYLGSDFRYRYIDYESGEWTVWCKMTPERYFKAIEDQSVEDIQLSLRPLSDMTEDEAYECIQQNPFYAKYQIIDACC